MYRSFIIKILILIRTRIQVQNKQMARERTRISWTSSILDKNTSIYNDKYDDHVIFYIVPSSRADRRSDFYTTGHTTQPSIFLVKTIETTQQWSEESFKSCSICSESWFASQVIKPFLSSQYSFFCFFAARLQIKISLVLSMALILLGIWGVSSICRSGEKIS